MKLRNFLLIGAMALCGISSALANVTVYITGSTAFRSETHTAILGIFTGTPTYAYSGANLGGSTQAMFQGTVTGVTGTTTIKTSWAGSVGGIQSVIAGTAPAGFANYLDASTPLVAGGQTVAGHLTDTTAGADLAMADNKVESTLFDPSSVNQDRVGIVPFTYIASKDAPSSVTNVSPELVRAFLANGYLAASIVDNDNSHRTWNGGTGPLLVMVGRNNDSGTRVNTFAESGFGVFTAPNQYPAPTLSGNTITAFGAPGDTTQGQASGGTVADINRRSSSSGVTVSGAGFTGAVGIVSYVGIPDAIRGMEGKGSSVGGTGAGFARPLAYNGVNAFTTTGAGKSITCTTTNGSANLTGISDANIAGLVVNQPVAALNLKGGTFISAIALSPGNNTITLGTYSTTAGDQNATGGGSVTAIIGLHYDFQPVNVRNGTYQFWGYEYLMSKISNEGSDKGTVKTKILAAFPAAISPSTSGALIDDDAPSSPTYVAVFRNGYNDGADIVQKN